MLTINDVTYIVASINVHGDGHILRPAIPSDAPQTREININMATPPSVPLSREAALHMAQEITANLWTPNPMFQSMSRVPPQTNERLEGRVSDVYIYDHAITPGEAQIMFNPNSHHVEGLVGSGLARVMVTPGDGHITVYHRTPEQNTPESSTVEPKVVARRDMLARIRRAIHL